MIRYTQTLDKTLDPVSSSRHGVVYTYPSVSVTRLFADVWNMHLQSCKIFTGTQREKERERERKSERVPRTREQRHAHAAVRTSRLPTDCMGFSNFKYGDLRHSCCTTRSHVPASAARHAGMRLGFYPFRNPHNGRVMGIVPTYCLTRCHIFFSGTGAFVPSVVPTQKLIQWRVCGPQGVTPPVGSVLFTVPVYWRPGPTVLPPGQHELGSSPGSPEGTDMRLTRVFCSQFLLREDRLTDVAST